MTNRQVALFNPSRMLEDNLFDSLFPRTFNDYHSNELEMYEDANNVVVRIKTPGFEEKDLDISIEDNVLNISGNINEEIKDEDKSKKYYYREIRNQSFSRSVSLPSRIRPDKCDAQIINGILEIRLPKAEESKPKKISIKPSTKQI